MLRVSFSRPWCVSCRWRQWFLLLLNCSQRTRLAGLGRLYGLTWYTYLQRTGRWKTVIQTCFGRSRTCLHFFTFSKKNVPSSSQNDFLGLEEDKKYHRKAADLVQNFELFIRKKAQHIGSRSQSLHSDFIKTGRFHPQTMYGLPYPPLLNFLEAS